MKRLFNSLITAALSLACVSGLLFAYSGEKLPVEIKLNASYTGENNMDVSITLNSKDAVKAKTEIRFKGGLELISSPDNALMLEGDVNSYVSSRVTFPDYDEAYQVTVSAEELTDGCQECGAPRTNTETFYLITLRGSPLVMDYTDYYQRLIEDKSFAARMGFLVTESKRYPGIKGLFNFRELGMSYSQAVEHHANLFEGNNNPPGKIKSMKKLDKSKSQLASTVNRSGRVTWISHRDTIPPLYKPVYGLPNAEIAIVAYYFPAFEETWGYGTTDGDGYWSVNLEVPAGQTLDNWTGIQVYFKNDDAAIEVQHPSTGLYMYETAKNSPYNIYFDSLSAYNTPARLHWPIMKSYAISSTSGFDGDSVTVIGPKDLPLGVRGWYGSGEIEIDEYNTMFSHEVVAHEHGHHIMHQVMGCIPGTHNSGECSSTDLDKQWVGSWAYFWSFRLTVPYQLANYRGVGAKDSCEIDPACGLITTRRPLNATYALWDLYDTSTDEPGEYWDKMDDALASDTLWSIYEFIDALKDQYPSQATKDSIELVIERNLVRPTLLASSKETETRSSLPKAFSLEQNTPNPFNPSTTISFSLPDKSESVYLDIYNLRGEKVKTLFQGNKESGSYTVSWDGTDDSGKKVSSGVYFYRLSETGKSLTRKMILLK